MTTLGEEKKDINEGELLEVELMGSEYLDWSERTPCRANTR